MKRRGERAGSRIPQLDFHELTPLHAQAGNSPAAILIAGDDRDLAHRGVVLPLAVQWNLAVNVPKDHLAGEISRDERSFPARDRQAGHLRPMSVEQPRGPFNQPTQVLQLKACRIVCSRGKVLKNWLE